MTVGIGDKLGVHEILSLLGKGGMGEVYRARDSRLKRDVAIKILPPEFAGDPDRLLRFRREAEVLASLNHPNIGAIYDFQEAGDVQFLVMELVEGETLADRLQRGPLPVEEALGIAAHICDALDAAHEKGVIHRDLKPANISVTPDGRVKVLDFGLAKAMEPSRASGTMANSPTLSLTATHAGLILGTAAYMSPEQAKGFEVDRRSDIFSFGCVFYEMLTGRQTFQGDTVPDVLASVLVREPDLSQLSPTFNPRLTELLQRCLHKNPKRRWHAAGDVREEIEIIKSNPLAVAAATSVSTAARPLWKRAVPVVVTAVLCSAIAAVAAWTLKPARPSMPARFAIVLPEGQNFTRTRSTVSAISPDGSMVAYVANAQLYLRRLNELEAKPISGTNEDVGTPFFSPDSKWVGFFSFSDGTIKKVPVTGGAPVPICAGCTNTLGGGVSWTADSIVFVRGGQEILTVPESGGQPETLIKAGPNELLGSPQILPGGKRLLFSVLVSGENWDNANVFVLTESGERKLAIRSGTGARYLSTGHIAYRVRGNLFVVPFDIDAVEQTGDPVQIVEGLLRSIIEYGAANFDISENGTLIYTVGSAAEGGNGLRVLAIADKAGNTRPLTGLPPGAYNSPRVSPNGEQIAFETIDDASIAIYDLSGTSQMRRLTTEGTNQAPVWSPDSTWLAFRSVRDGQPGLFIQRADGSTPAERLTTVTAGIEMPLAWSTDDRILFIRGRAAWMFFLKDRRAEEMPGQPREGRSSGNLSLSRDGWMAFAITEGRPPGFRIFLRQFPTGPTNYPVSRELGNTPVWSYDGRDLFYFQPETRNLVSVTITRPPAFSVSKVSVIPIKSMLQPEGSIRQFDVMRNDEFLILQPAAQQGESDIRQTQQIHVVLNWSDELAQIAPRR